jgi:flavorubredoxin
MAEIVSTTACKAQGNVMNEPAMGPIEVLAPGRLYALQNVITLDGRISSYPANARGFTVSNCYLIKEGNDAVLLDSGYSAHERSLLAQIESLLEPDATLSVYPLRINEYMSVCNVEAIAARFNVVQCYSGNPDAALWVDFGGRSDSTARQPKPYSLRTTLVARKQTLHVGRDQSRAIEAFQAPIRLIGTRWIYDGATRTLFTSDSFSHEWADDPDGPWATYAADNTTTLEHIRSFLLNTRYWWLEGGDTESLRRKVAEVFQRYEIETIAPGYGRVLRGRDLVERQFAMFDEVLRRLDRGMVAPSYVDRDELR